MPYEWVAPEQQLSATSAEFHVPPWEPPTSDH